LGGEPWAHPLATLLPKTSKNVPLQKKNQASDASYAGFAQSCGIMPVTEKTFKSSFASTENNFRLLLAF